MSLRSLIAAAPPPAPETPHLRRLRRRTVVACALAAITVASVEALVALDRLLVLLVVPVVGYGVCALVRYWRLKARIDADYAAALTGRTPFGDRR